MHAYRATQARSNVAKRLDFIRRELERLESQAGSMAEKQGRKQQQVRLRGLLRVDSYSFCSGPRHHGRRMAASLGPTVVLLQHRALRRG